MCTKKNLQRQLQARLYPCARGSWARASPSVARPSAAVCACRPPARPRSSRRESRARPSRRARHAARGSHYPHCGPRTLQKRSREKRRRPLSVRRVRASPSVESGRGEGPRNVRDVGVKNKRQAVLARRAERMCKMKGVGAGGRRQSRPAACGQSGRQRGSVRSASAHTAGRNVQCQACSGSAQRIIMQDRSGAEAQDTVCSASGRFWAVSSGSGRSGGSCGLPNRKVTPAAAASCWRLLHR